MASGRAGEPAGGHPLRGRQPDLMYCAEALLDAFPDADLADHPGRLDAVAGMLADPAVLAWFRPGSADVDAEFPHPVLSPRPATWTGTMPRSTGRTARDLIGAGVGVPVRELGVQLRVQAARREQIRMRAAGSAPLVDEDLVRLLDGGQPVRDDQDVRPLSAVLSAACTAASDSGVHARFVQHHHRRGLPAAAGRWPSRFSPPVAGSPGPVLRPSGSAEIRSQICAAWHAAISAASVASGRA